MFIHDIIKIEYIRQGYLPDFPYHLTSDAEMFGAFLVDEMKVSKDKAEKIKEGNATLWDSPKTYLDLYKLSSFEFIVEDDDYLVLRGRRDKLAEFNELVNLRETCYVSAECYFSVNYPLLQDEMRDAYNDLVDAIYYHIQTHLDSVCDVIPVAVPDWVYSYMNGAVIGVNSDSLDKHDFFSLMNLDNQAGEFTKEIFESCLDISTKWVKKLPPSKNTMRPPTMYGEPHVIKSLRIAGTLADEIV